MSERRIIDSEELARVFGVTVETVRGWVRERRVPFIRVSRRIVRFDLEDVLAALRQGVAQ